jgi:predicted anti-sigma-YlaC factor YlaD
LHDAGVFQIAIGLMMLAAVWWRDAVAVTLAGFVFTNAFHAHNHFVDRSAGGRRGDWQSLAVLAGMGAVLLAVHLRREGRRRSARGARSVPGERTDPAGPPAP